MHKKYPNLPNKLYNIYKKSTDCNKIIKVFKKNTEHACVEIGKHVMETLEDIDLKKVGLELMFLTPEKCSRDGGISAVELSKVLDMPLDTVKKKLKILLDKEIIRVYGINPKLWKFDEFKFQKMDEEDDVFLLLSCFDDVDFDKYFSY